MVNEAMSSFNSLACSNDSILVAVASTYLQIGHLKPSCLASVATILNILVKSPVCMAQAVAI